MNRSQIFRYENSSRRLRPIGVRDRALVVLGFAGAFRRSELVGLIVEDCAFSKDGLTVTLRRSKTDQDGAGHKIGIPFGANRETCPVRNVQAWLELVDSSTGPLFRSLSRHGRLQPGRLSGVDVARIVKKLADRPDWMLRSTPGIHSGPGTLPVRPSLARRSARL